MTDEQINVAIAEACGWTDIHDSGVSHQPKFLGYPPLGEWQKWKFFSLPNYCNDLNAMHVAENVLNTDELFEKYYLALYDITQSTRWWPVCATAQQRAEAFLRTLGRWEE